MGSPAKSEGSRMEAITVSHGNPMIWAMARIADVLPVPGAPHSSTGTRAATATPSASTAGLFGLIASQCGASAAFGRTSRPPPAGPGAVACTSSGTGSVPGARRARTCASGQPARATATTRCRPVRASPAAHTRASQPAGRLTRSRRCPPRPVSSADPQPGPRCSVTTTWSGSMPSHSSATGASRAVIAATSAGLIFSIASSGRPACASATWPISLTWNP